jgi:hypothetical protein
MSNLMEILILRRVADAGNYGVQPVGAADITAASTLDGRAGPSACYRRWGACRH